MILVQLTVDTARSHNICFRECNKLHNGWMRVSRKEITVFLPGCHYGTQGIRCRFCGPVYCLFLELIPFRELFFVFGEVDGWLADC
jgi:hypothetical protein